MNDSFPEPRYILQRTFDKSVSDKSAISNTFHGHQFVSNSFHSSCIVSMTYHSSQ